MHKFHDKIKPKLPDGRFGGNEGSASSGRGVALVPTHKVQPTSSPEKIPE